MKQNAGSKILVVEDEAILALATKRKLESFGYEASLASSGEAALESVQSDQGIALVLMDIDLGSGMSGPDAARAILGIRPLPIVFLTSHSEAAMVEQVRHVTRYGYLLKNSGDFVLRSSLEMAFELFESNLALEREKERLRTTLDSIGDAVLTTDVQGRVTGMNPVAESLTGWTLGEASGRPIGEVFAIFNASTGEPASNPISKVLETGLVQGLANHTELVSRDGTRYQISDSAAPIKDADGAIGGMVLVFSDVSETYRIQAALRASEERYRLLFRNLNSNFALHEILLDADGSPFDYRFLEVNPAFEAAVGMKAEEIVGRTALELFPLTERYWIERFGEVALSGRPIQYENYSAAFDRYYQMNVYSPRKGQFAYLALDVTEHRGAEALGKQLLAEKDLLLKEVHHRIKNNMHTVIDLLSLQSGTVGDAKASEALDDAANRVRSMFRLYEKIYEGPSYTEVGAGEYVSALVEEIAATFANRPNVAIELRIEDLSLDARRVQPLGILLNELLTNCMKHAFVGRSEGSIRVELSSAGGRVRLAVSDDGVGLPVGLDGASSKGLGLSLIEALAGQLSAALSIDRSGGTSVAIEFDEDDAKRKPARA